MRVFELAENLKSTGGIVLRAAKELDLEAHSLMSRLDDDDVASLKNYFASHKLTVESTQQSEELAKRRGRALARERERLANERKLLEDAIALARSYEAEIKGTSTKGEKAPAKKEAATEKPAVTTETPPEVVAAAPESAPEEPAAAQPEAAQPEATADIELAAIPSDEDSRVVIHAAVEDSPATPDKLIADVIDDLDADEELESAYGGGHRSQAAGFMRQPVSRPRGAARDPEPPRPASKGRAATQRKRPASDGDTADKRATAPAAPRPEKKRQRAPLAKGKAIRGQQPIVRGITTPETAEQAEKARFAPLTPATQSTDKVILLRGPVMIKDLAQMMDVRPNRLIADMMQMNELFTLNQRVDLEKANRIASKYGYKAELERARRSAARKPAIKRLDEEDDIPEDQPEDMKPRPPVVTFLGHVDHGKTSLMDAIRKTQQTAAEAGGITQHIGAYSVELAGRKITFLDTPGHAAFSAMRARGANLTDVAVVIIAADDGIMPQTREVIKQAQHANVQIMVAINKCDLPTAKPDRIRQQLQAEGLTPEEWGGDLVVCEVSAHTGDGLEHLLEMILLQADMLELEANPNRRADGYVIEAQMEQGRGPTASLLVASGTLKRGDVVLIGEHFGRLRGLMDDRGRNILKAGPATAVRVMGLSGVPEAGAEFRVMVNEKRARELAEKFAEERKNADLLAASATTISADNLFAQLDAQQKQQLELIIKGDTQGSVEAIIDSLNDIRSEKVSLNIIASGIGNITTNDIQRAVAGSATVVGFQVALDSGVAAAARHEKVRVHTYRIIYELLDQVKSLMLDLIVPEYREAVKGHAQIRAIFDIGGKGRIAGCQLLDGNINRRNPVRIKRGRDVIYEGKVDTLRHFQADVDEVRDLQECGISFTGFEDFAEGDVVESYAMEELEKTL